MYRTGKGSILNSKSAEVNRTKPKSLRYKRVKRLVNSKEPSKVVPLLGSQRLFIGVLSDDFAAVDVREELCEPKPAERGKFKGVIVNGQ